jgi:abequosyltransferase
MKYLGRELNKVPLLSICIPTYNQPEALAQTLESMLSQAMSDVEIVIRDDSPDSQSEDVVRRYLSLLPIRYFHGEKDGVDKAVMFITEQARGKYIWWFGDDVMADGAIEYMIRLITTYPDISFVWVNSQTIGGGMLSLDLGCDRFFKNNDEVLEYVGDLLGYISATVFRRDLVSGGMRYAERHVGTAFVTLFLVLYVLSQPGKYFYVQTPYVLGDARPETGPHWYDPFQVFAVNLYEVVTDPIFRGRFSEKSIKNMLSNNFGSIWRTILVQRAKGQVWGLGSDSPKVMTMFLLYWRFAEFWLALPFLVAPRFVVRIAYRIYKFFFKKTRIRFRQAHASSDGK